MTTLQLNKRNFGSVVLKLANYLNQNTDQTITLQLPTIKHAKTKKINLHQVIKDTKQNYSVAHSSEELFKKIFNS
jgi:hypothetical protein